MPETVLWLFSLGVFLLKYVLWHDRWKASKKNYIPCNTCWTGSPWTCWSVVKMSHIVQYPNYTVCPLWRKTRVSVPLLLLVWHFSCSHKTLSTGNPVYLYQEDKVVLLQRIGHREGISSSWCARVRLSLSVLVKPLVLASVKKTERKISFQSCFYFSHVTSSLRSILSERSTRHVLNGHEGRDVTLLVYFLPQIQITICFYSMLCLQ